MNNYINNLPQSIKKQKYTSTLINNFAHDSSIKINNNFNASFSKRNHFFKIEKKKSISIIDIKKKLGFKSFIKYAFQKNNYKQALFFIFKFREKMLSEEHLYNNHLQQIFIINKLENKKFSEYDLTEIFKKL